MTYFRVGNKNENLLETCSVELATDLHCVTEDEIFEMYGVSDEDELNDALDTHIWFDSEGHFGAGIYYNGVCCAESLKKLKSYFSGNSRGLEGSVVFVFDGEYMGSCNDGSVVNPTHLIETLSVKVLDS